jgi:predicted AAA+ superfamily ATPase
VGVDVLKILLYYNHNFGINTFYLDEIQSLENWPNLLKNIYDLGRINVIFS